MNKIIFYPQSKLVSEIIPAPISSSTPTWYKDIPMYQDREDRANDKLTIKDGSANYSVKSCMPFLDSMLSGYTINLWCDVQVRFEDNVLRVDWLNQNKDLAPIESGPNPKVPIMKGFTPYQLSWRSHWGIKTPKGYSCLLTHPLNRSDLPFHTTTGIMDTDSWGIWGTQPFALIDGWEGVIKAGTPVIQVLPFKRENWRSEIDTLTGNGSLSEWANYEYQRHTSKFRGFYKSKYWSKKTYL
jgi:hypothetical protein